MLLVQEGGEKETEKKETQGFAEGAGAVWRGWRWMLLVAQ